MTPTFTHTIVFIAGFVAGAAITLSALFGG